MGWMMELSGQEIRIAYNGRSAIEIARSYCPDVVFLDIGLPEMNGYEICEATHQEPMLNKTIFIAQTGWGQAEHRKRSRRRASTIIW